MNKSGSSDAAPRKRPAARRAVSSAEAAAERQAAPVEQVSDPVRESGAQFVPQTKRATARRGAAAPGTQPSNAAATASNRDDVANAPAPARQRAGTTSSSGHGLPHGATTSGARQVPRTAAAGSRATVVERKSLEAPARAYAPPLASSGRTEIASQARDRGHGSISPIATRPGDPIASTGAMARTDSAAGMQLPDLFSPAFYLRKWGRLAMRHHSEQVDDFGLDPAYEASVRPFFERICNRYFRTEIEGVEHIPNDGRALLVCNHSGALPWDGIMLRTALRLNHRARRELRWLVEDHVFHTPFLGTFVNRIGAVRACQENAERLLRREDLVAVFPEGIKGIAKPYSERYKLQRFGRGGYVRLALRTGAPVIPVAIVGAEETYPLLYKVSAFSKSLGLPFIPVTPTFPWLGPLGIAPLPSRWRISIGAPIHEIGRHEADAAKDEVLVHELNECARAAVRALLDNALRQRGHNAYV